MHKRPLYGDIKVIYKLLKKKLKPKYPVRLTFPKIMDCAGITEFDSKKKTFRIKITKELSNDAAIFTLLHEWSHIISFFSPDWIDGGDHSICWAIAYYQVYNIWLEYLET